MAMARSTFEVEGGWGYEVTQDGFCFLRQPHSPNDMSQMIATEQIAGLLADLIIEKREGIVPEKGSPAAASVYTSEEAAINDDPGGVDLHAMALAAWDAENPE